MSPRKVDPNAAKAKQKRQRVMLGVGGALLLAVLVIQGPKLMGGGSSSPAAEPAADGAAPTEAPTPTGTAAPPPAQQTTPASAPFAAARSITIAGVQVATPKGPAADADNGQLVSFAVFELTDPFVPEVVDPSAPGASGKSDGKGSKTVDAQAPKEDPKQDAGQDTAPGGAIVGGSDEPGTAPGPAAGGQDGTPAASTKPEKAPPPPDPTNATVSVNGAAEPLVPGQEFPKDDPLFVLFELEPGLAKIKVAGGGSFTSGKAVVLKKGSTLTFVNTATGARYQVELLYLGSVPEQVETFTSEGAAPARADAKTGEQAQPAP